MIKSLIAVALLCFGLQAFAQDGGDHSQTVCSALDANVCAHLGHMTKLDSSGEAQFVAHVMVAQQVSDMSVVLWMPEMGHGSSPVKLELFGLNKYKVTQAYFIMPGTWEVRLSFTLNGVKHNLAIPVNVEQ
ncbi:MAG: FixH family protein [Pseudobdellovibrio sp.]